MRRLALTLALLLAPRLLAGQERGAIALGEAVHSIGVNTRVLVIGAHPDDEDTFLIAWLSRGRGVETAYLSLTRGDGGQNLIGNELGEALGVIRTEELLAARRVDGALQYFSRAYDFGFSKDTIDTYAHWPRDSILGDVVRVVRAFKPHVIVAVFSGTPRDGHGHHQVSGVLARAAYDVSGDTARYPIARYGPGWTPLKFYRAARFSSEAATLTFDAGEYSPLLGRSYAEIAGESRSQHKSQGFGAPQRKGPVIDMLTREATRVNGESAATDERSLFDGIDTSWNRFARTPISAVARAKLDSLSRNFAIARRAFDPMRPEMLLPSLGASYRLVEELRRMSHLADADLRESLRIAERRVATALRLASGVEIEAIAPRETFPVGGTARVVVSVYNRGRTNVALLSAPVITVSPRVSDGRDDFAASRRQSIVAAGAMIVDTIAATFSRVDQPWWLRTPRMGSLFTQPASIVPAGDVTQGPQVRADIALPGGVDPIPFTAPVQVREVDPVKGETRRQVVGVPAISLRAEQHVQFVPANVDVLRDYTVVVRSADDRSRDVRVRLQVPPGLVADSAARSVTLPTYDATRSVTFHLRGRLAPGSYTIAASAESDGQTYSDGYQLIDYDHIRRQRVYHAASTVISSVDVRVPATVRVAYVQGVGDNVAPTLTQLGVPLTVLAPAEIARTDLTPFTTVVIGPRAYEAHPELVAANPHLFDFVRKGGTMVVQYGQYEMTQLGVMPYPITLARPADRVTEEDGPITVDVPDDPLLRAPNAISASDFAEWVQERALYMPRAFDEHYRSLLSMHDRGEAPNRAAILVTQLDRGVYIYTTLSFFRQLPAGVPGAARLFTNLLSANATSVSP